MKENSMSHTLRYLAGVSLSFALILPAAALAQASPTADERAVSSLEDRFLQARLTADTAAVQAIFATDGVFLHANGDRRSKSEYLEEMARTSHWTGVQEADRVVHIYGDTAVSRGVVFIKFGGKLTERLRATGVYVKQAGNWRIVSWQYTPLTDPNYSPGKL
jgi:uncharacterized protein (TIGR02246 family)